jgi:hypothetical protein
MRNLPQIGEVFLKAIPAKDPEIIHSAGAPFRTTENG